MADRQSEFLDRGARVYGLGADSPLQNSAVMDKLAIPFPILSDSERDQAIIPLGFEDEKDPRHISRPRVAIISSAGEIVHRFVGRDYADRPIEDELLADLKALNLDPVTQEVAEPGEIEHGEKAFPAEGLKYYFSGAKFATCLVDGLAPDVGRATVAALESAGCVVEFPAGQTCLRSARLQRGLEPTSEGNGRAHLGRARCHRGSNRAPVWILFGDDHPSLSATSLREQNEKIRPKALLNGPAS